MQYEHVWNLRQTLRTKTNLSEKKKSSLYLDTI